MRVVVPAGKESQEDSGDVDGLSGEHQVDGSGDSGRNSKSGSGRQSPGQSKYQKLSIMSVCLIVLALLGVYALNSDSGSHGAQGDSRNDLASGLSYEGEGLAALGRPAAVDDEAALLHHLQSTAWFSSLPEVTSIAECETFAQKRLQAVNVERLRHRHARYKQLGLVEGELVLDDTFAGWNLSVEQRRKFKEAEERLRPEINARLQAFVVKWDLDGDDVISASEQQQALGDLVGLQAMKSSVGVPKSIDAYAQHEVALRLCDANGDGFLDDVERYASRLFIRPLLRGKSVDLPVKSIVR